MERRSTKRFLREVACGLLAAALLACGGAPEPEGVRDISAEELLSGLPSGAVVLDVRRVDEFEAGHVPNAVNVPHDELAERLAGLALDPEAPVVVYCERGTRAGKAADVLIEAGHRDVRHLEGDMSGWRAAGRPVEGI